MGALSKLEFKARVWSTFTLFWFNEGRGFSDFYFSTTNTISFYEESVKLARIYTWFLK